MPLTDFNEERNIKKPSIIGKFYAFVTRLLFKSENENSNKKHIDTDIYGSTIPLNIPTKTENQELSRIRKFNKNQTKLSIAELADEIKKIRKSLSFIKLLLIALLIVIIYPQLIGIVGFVKDRILSLFIVNEQQAVNVNHNQTNKTYTKKILAGTYFEGKNQNGKSFKAVQIDVSKIGLYLDDELGKALSNFENLGDWLNKSNRKLVFAMNAGIYGQDYRPLGLHVENGKTFRELNLSKEEKVGNDNPITGNFFMLPNGVFLVKDEVVSIVESNSLKEKNNWEDTKFATQSGPLLLLNNQVHPSFKQNSENEKIRNGVGILDKKTAVFIITKDPVTFYEFAMIFKDTFSCKDALYLDGVISDMYISETGAENNKKDKFAGMFAVSVPTEENPN